ncbi:MAG: chemotaxis-specific protein-glutamate methyltransferase CheB [bacterium]
MKEDSIKVLIADDSPVVREILKDMIEGEPDLELLGEARDGKEAVELAESLKPAIITMDVMMPVMNGLEAVEEIMAFTPTPILVFSSAVNNKEMNVAFEAIARGALDVMEKPRVSEGAKYDSIRKDFLAKLRMLSRIQVISHLKGRRRRPRTVERVAEAPEDEAKKKVKDEAPASETGAGPVDTDVVPPPEVMERPLPIIEAPAAVKVPAGKTDRELVAMGASTGGPKALVQIFRKMPADFPVPVLAVQHIAHSFAPGLVNWLGRESRMKVELAAEKVRPEPGVLYISPTDVHMVLEKGLIRLSKDPPVNSCRPSVDVLFSSVARDTGETAVGALLTGMGRDGARGLLEIKRRKGWALIQDEKSSIIFGMPKAALDMGAYDEVVALPEFADALTRALFRKNRH